MDFDGLDFDFDFIHGRFKHFINSREPPKTRRQTPCWCRLKPILCAHSSSRPLQIGPGGPACVVPRAEIRHENTTAVVLKKLFTSTAQRSDCSGAVWFGSVKKKKKLVSESINEEICSTKSECRKDVDPKRFHIAHGDCLCERTLILRGETRP